VNAAQLLVALDMVEGEVVRAGILSGLRCDGRSRDDLRPIHGEVALLPSVVHGSSIFCRGDTQALATVTVGSLDGPPLPSAQFPIPPSGGEGFGSAERRHLTGRERTGSPTLQTLQYPILLLPWLCFEAAAFQHLRQKENRPLGLLALLQRDRVISGGALEAARIRYWLGGGPAPEEEAFCKQLRLTHDAGYDAARR
jgi:hypothetical protein